MSCLVSAQGGLTQCTVLREEPLNEDNGAVALRATAVMNMLPEDADGREVAGRLVRLPFTFLFD